MRDAQQNALIRQAIRSARNAPRGLGIRESDSIDYLPSGGVQLISGGLMVVHLRQHLFGVPLLHAGRSARFDASGAFLGVTGRPTSVDPSLSTMPVASATKATAIACGHLFEREESVGKRTPAPRGRLTVRAELNDPAQTTVLHRAPFRDPIIARLIVFGEGPSAALAWEVRLRLPGPHGSFAVFVEAGRRRGPRVLDCIRMSTHASASGPVYEFNPDEMRAAIPHSFPADRSQYPRLWDRPLPDTEWIDSDATSGNSASSVDHKGKSFKASLRDGLLAFSPTNPGSEGVVNAFYLVNFMHDFFWLLGFDEGLGNFQRRNRTGTGRAGDAVRITVWPEPFDGIADFVSQVDGFPPELNLGPAVTTRGNRSSALDADIVFHEYTHGVTNRLIGGPRAEHPLVKFQSRALGEGYSDYFAVSIQNHLRRRAGRPPVMTFGAYICPDRPTGLRNQQYGSLFRGSYGDLGTAAFQKPHDAGAVWCEALLRVNAALAPDGDPALGDELGWQLVLDSLRLLHPGPSGPTFLHARDALLTALDTCPPTLLTAPRDALRNKVASVFSSLGMGPRASTTSADLGGIREDFDR